MKVRGEYYEKLAIYIYMFGTKNTEADKKFSQKRREREFYLAQTRTVLTPRIMGVAR